MRPAIFTRKSGLRQQPGFGVAAGDGRHFFLQLAQLARQVRLLAIGGVQGFTLLLQQAFQRISFLLLALLHAVKLLLQRLIGGDQLLCLLMRMVITARAEGDDQHDSDRAEHRAGVLAFAAGSGWLLGLSTAVVGSSTGAAGVFCSVIVAHPIVRLL